MPNKILFEKVTLKLLKQILHKRLKNYYVVLKLYLQQLQNTKQITNLLLYFKSLNKLLVI